MPRSRRVEVWTGARFGGLLFPQTPANPEQSPAPDQSGDTTVAPVPIELLLKEIPLKFVQQVGEYVPGPTDFAELWGGINLILLFANDHGDDGEPREGSASWLTYFHSAAHEAHVARVFHQLLTLLSEGADDYPRVRLPLQAFLAFRNLVAIVKRGGYHVHRCPTCTNWFLTTHARRQQCYRATCATTAKRTYDADRRRDERARRRAERQRLERERDARRVTRKGTSRTK